MPATATATLVLPTIVENEKSFPIEIVPTNDMTTAAEDKQHTKTGNPYHSSPVVVQTTTVTTQFIPMYNTTCCNNNSSRQCTILAKEYLSTLHATRYPKQQSITACNAALLATVERAVKLLQSHKSHPTLSWYFPLLKELCEMGKWIKDESVEVDRIIPLSSIYQYSIHIDQEEASCSIYETYGRAIRIAIYYCRAGLTDGERAIHYYHKCISVLPPSDCITTDKNIQQMALQHLMATVGQHQEHDRPRLPSRTSSFSSFASSSSSMTCSNCGIEKRGMPVCSKCKSQYYCSLHCLKSHQPIHHLECRNK
ncbi:MAG: hypothetical protein EXX96DRAFT_573805 [Benjaminiella poitrasii]|nr:MAG: hypothetical protein EXX96DRAFT_573805 [Benjaminiella poitrasii]